MLHVANSPFGPWEPVLSPLPDCWTPSQHQLRNGSFTDADSGVDGYASETLEADTWALAPWAAGFVELVG